MHSADNSPLELSIILPVYNVEPYIIRCLDSVINLTIPNYEIIVVNDGTEDNSMDVVIEYANIYENISIVNQTNQGLGEARNVGLRNAKGKYVYFLDSDDYIDPSLFISLFNTRQSDIDIIIGDYYIEQNNKICHGTYKIGSTSGIKMNGKDFFLRYYRRNINTMVWRSIYRKEFLISNNLFFTKRIFHEDINWTPKAILKANTIIYLPVSFYYYQIRSGSIINSNLSEKKFYDQLYAYNDLQSIACEYLKDIQKEISYLSVIGMLVIVGRFWKIIDHKKIKTDLRTIMTFNCSHYIKVNLLRFLFLLFPSFVGKMMYLLYGK